MAGCAPRYPACAEGQTQGPLRRYKQAAALRRAPKVAMNTFRLAPGLTALLLLSLGAACASDLGPVAPVGASGSGAAGPATDDALATIHALVGDGACDSDTVCRSMPIGAKACGGPEGSFAWSTQRSDASKLADAVARYNAGRVAMNARDGRVSNCAMEIDPGVACLPKGTAGGPARRCQLLPRGTGAGSQAR